MPTSKSWSPARRHFENINIIVRILLMVVCKYALYVFVTFTIKRSISSVQLNKTAFTLYPVFHSYIPSSL